MHIEFGHAVVGFVQSRFELERDVLKVSTVTGTPHDIDSLGSPLSSSIYPLGMLLGFQFDATMRLEASSSSLVMQTLT